MTVLSSTVRRRGQNWTVSLKTADGRRLQFRCSSRNQARYFAAVFELGPSWIPSWMNTSHPGGRTTRARPRLAFRSA